MIAAEPAQPPRPIDRVPRGADVAIVLLALGLMLGSTWRKWPDPLIDFGRELYLAWQVSLGQTLYRDVEHFNGPLSVQFNALLFRLFGPGLMTLVTANILLAGAAAILLVAILRRARGGTAATAGGLVFATVFACGQFVDTGNYNFITPYSHEVTHGVILALACVWTMGWWSRTQGSIAAALTGVLLGLAWLTKLEVFIAALVAVGVGLIACAPSRSEERIAGGNCRARFGRCAAIIVGAMLAIMLAAWLLLLRSLPPGEALRGVMGSAWHALDARLAQLPFYQRVAGVDDVAGNLVRMLISAVAISGLMWMSSMLANRASASTAARRGAWMAALAIPVLAVATFNLVPWHQAVRGLPVVIGVLLVKAFFDARKSQSPADLLWLMLLALSLGLLARIALAAGVQHYGFALAMPATVAVAAALVQPRLRRGEEAELTKTPRGAVSIVGLSVVATFVGVHLFVYARLYASKPVQIADGADVFLAGAGIDAAPSRGQSLAALLAAIEKSVPPDATLAVIPEGAMVNYLTRRKNPTPFITLQPPEYLMFGGGRITRAYQSKPPDFAVINLTVDPSEYGSKGFDQDYGRELSEWIKQHYEPRQQAGRLVLLQRRSAEIILPADRK